MWGEFVKKIERSVHVFEPVSYFIPEISNEFIPILEKEIEYRKGYNIIHAQMDFEYDQQQ